MSRVEEIEAQYFPDGEWQWEDVSERNMRYLLDRVKKLEAVREAAIRLLEFGICCDCEDTHFHDDDCQWYPRAMSLERVIKACEETNE